MGDGFFGRVALTCSNLSRRLGTLADAVRTAGVPAQAAVAQGAADALARLAFDAEHDQVEYARIAEDADACARALQAMTGELEDCGVDEAMLESAAGAVEELQRISRDALSQTQPIDL